MKNIIRIGECILDYRKQHGLTQSEFGELLGVSTQAVSKWERGLSSPDVSLINRIAVELKLSIAQLLEGCITDFELSSNLIHQNEITSEANFNFKEKIEFSSKNHIKLMEALGENV